LRRGAAALARGNPSRSRKPGQASNSAPGIHSAQTHLPSELRMCSEPAVLRQASHLKSFLILFFSEI
jgi:hypothetical protein